MIEATEHPQLCVQTDVSLTIYHVDTYTTDNIWCNQRFLKGTLLNFQLQHEMELDGSFKLICRDIWLSLKFSLTSMQFYSNQGARDKR